MAEMDEKDRKSHKKYKRWQLVRETPEKESVEEADEESSGQSRPPKEKTVMEISVLLKKGRKSRFIIPLKQLASGSSSKEEAEEEDEEQEGKKADEKGIASKMMPRPPASWPPGFLRLKRKADKEDACRWFQMRLTSKAGKAEQVSKNSKSTQTPAWTAERESWGDRPIVV